MVDENLSPILVVGFNRPKHLSKCLNSLVANKSFLLHRVIVSIDGPRDDTDNYACLQTLRAAERFKDLFPNVELLVHEKNYGVGNFILNNVDSIFLEASSIIVIEDDLVVSPLFLEYCNWGLERFRNVDRVASVVGFSLNLPSQKQNYFLRGADCWGWATWRNRWETFERDGRVLLKEIKYRKLIRQFDLDYSYQYTSMLERQVHGLNNSWAIRWHADNFLKNRLSLYPGKSLVLNEGNDGSGTNMGNTDVYETTLSLSELSFNSPELVEDKQALKEIIRYYQKKFPQKFQRRLLNELRRLVY